MPAPIADTSKSDVHDEKGSFPLYRGTKRVNSGQERLIYELIQDGKKANQRKKKKPAGAGGTVP
jgi:hypothetical protein